MGDGKVQAGYVHDVRSDRYRCPLRVLRPQWLSVLPACAERDQGRAVRPDRLYGVYVDGGRAAQRAERLHRTQWLPDAQGPWRTRYVLGHWRAVGDALAVSQQHHHGDDLRQDGEEHLDQSALYAYLAVQHRGRLQLRGVVSRHLDQPDGGAGRQDQHRRPAVADPLGVDRLAVVRRHAALLLSAQTRWPEPDPGG